MSIEYKFAEIMTQLKPIKGIKIIQEVKSRPPRKYIWKGIPEGSTGMIAGVAKTGKTRFAENLAMSIAVGRSEYFGFSMEGLPRKVLFVNLEEDTITFGERNAKQIDELSPTELQQFEDNYFTIDDDFPSFFNSQDDWELIMRFIIDSQADVVIIDSLTHMLVGDIERSSVSQAFIQKFQKLKKLGKTIIVVHHNTKGNDKPIDQNSVAGSRVILQEFDYVFGLANSPYGKSYGCMLHNKYLPKDDQTAYTYEVKETGWLVRDDTVNKYSLYKNPYEKSKTDHKEELFMKFFSSKPNIKLTTAEIKSHFTQSHGLSERAVERKLKELVDDGKIEKPSTGKYQFTKEDSND